MTSAKLGNTANWKKKNCWMAVSVEYAVEGAMDLSHRLRYDDNNQATDRKAENQWFVSWYRQGCFYLFQYDQIGCMAHSAASQGVREDHSVAVKRSGRDAVGCCPV